MLIRPCSLDELLPDDHDARTIWAVVCPFDLGGFLEPIRAHGAEAGRAATDPRILIALWLDAATRGIASARELDRLCRESDPDRWIGGTGTLNYHTLSDFRVAHGAALDNLLTQLLTVLIQGQAVSVERIAQDGTRVRVSAGANRFQKRDTLEQARPKAQAHLAIIGRQADRREEATVRRPKAEHRAAEAKLARIEEALKPWAEVERAKAEPKDKPTKKNPPKPRRPTRSTVPADARRR